MQNNRHHNIKKPLRHRFAVLWTAFLTVVAVLLAVPAAIFADTIVDPSQTGSITIIYTDQDGEAIGGSTFSVRMVGEPVWNGSFRSLVETPIDAETEPASIVEQAMDLPAQELKVGPDGLGGIQELAQGLYLVTEDEPAEGYFASTPFFATIPFMQEGEWAYDVIAKPKPVSVGSLVIQKQVTGSLGEKARQFRFQVEFSLEEEMPIRYSTGESGTIKSGDTILLTHGQKAAITMLPPGTEYSVKELDADTDGYTTTAKGDSGTINTKTPAVATFVNSKGDVTPTPPEGGTPTPPGNGTPTPPGGNTPTPPGRATPTPSTPYRPPQTGDTSNMGLFIALAVGAGVVALVAILCIVKRKRNKR